MATPLSPYGPLHNIQCCCNRLKKSWTGYWNTRFVAFPLRTFDGPFSGHENCFYLSLLLVRISVCSISDTRISYTCMQTRFSYSNIYSRFDRMSHWALSRWDPIHNSKFFSLQNLLETLSAHLLRFKGGFSPVIYKPKFCTHYHLPYVLYMLP